ncbi:hypothetical protein D3C77_631460 [compost metagenome]
MINIVFALGHIQILLLEGAVIGFVEILILQKDEHAHIQPGCLHRILEFGSKRRNRPIISIPAVLEMA